MIGTLHHLLASNEASAFDLLTKIFINIALDHIDPDASCQ